MATDPPTHSRAARSDAAYVSLHADIAALQSQLAAPSSAPDAASALAALQKRAAAAAETLGAYDARKIAEEIDAVAKMVAARGRRPKFAFRRRTPVAPTATATPAAVTSAITAPKSVSVDTAPAPASAPADVRDRTDASLRVSGASSSIRLENLARSAVWISSPVAGSVTVRGCTGCVVWAAARQVRVHDCSRCLFVLRSASGPVIERCSGLVFAEWDGGSPKRKWEEVPLPAGKATVAGMETGEEINRWREVQDFNWLQEAHSPNWRVLGEAEAVDVEKWMRVDGD